MREDNTYEPEQISKNIAHFEHNIQSKISNSVDYNMMKFPRPKILEHNPYPDIDATQPELLHNLVQNFVKPKEKSPMDSYLQNTIEYLKSIQRNKGTVKINNYSVGTNLFFTDIKINKDSEVIPCLVDTGATNSLIHTSIARKLNLKIIQIGRAHV